MGRFGTGQAQPGQYWPSATRTVQAECSQDRILAECSLDRVLAECSRDSTSTILPTQGGELQLLRKQLYC